MLSVTTTNYRAPFYLSANDQQDDELTTTSCAALLNVAAPNISHVRPTIMRSKLKQQK